MQVRKNHFATVTFPALLCCCVAPQIHTCVDALVVINKALNGKENLDKGYVAVQDLQFACFVWKILCFRMFSFFFS